MSVPNRTSTNYLGRLVDLVSHDGLSTSAGSLDDLYQQVYGYNCRDCDPPQTQVLRYIDNTTQPSVDVGDDPADPNEEALVPTFAQIQSCQKDWDGPEEYIDYDMGSGYIRRISKELNVLLIGMDDCSIDGETCISVTLTFDPSAGLGTGGFTGSVDLLLGTATFDVYGVWTGISEEWFNILGGCPSGGTQPLAGQCVSPLMLSGIGGGGPFGLACCPAVPPPNPYYVWEKIPPRYVGRLIDVVDPAEQSSSSSGENLDPIPVYLVAECCNTGCPFNPGCCNGISIDDGLFYTIFNIITTNGNPPCTRTCTGADVSPTLSNGCVIWSVTTCPAPHTICLSCNVARSANSGERGWQNYQLFAAGVYWQPSSGSCEPFSVTFDNIPWTAPSPAGLCSGTYSVTVTR